MNRRIAMSGLSILTTLVMLGGSAFAAFSTQAITTGNTFTADVPNLTVNLDAGGEGTSVPGMAVSGLYPGGPASNHSFDLHNTGTNGLAVNFNFNNDGSSTLPGTDTTIAVDCSADGGAFVSDTYSGWMTGHALGTVAAGDTMTCSMSVSLNSGVGNSDIGLFDKFDGIFTGSEGL